ncbi:Pentatricopeptide repeat-containing protein [Canna indica]|uniref:Pentatricopeptide repeat-containing protein n=1 Tax=Canna indica TaxID=4628 RepID=A0AAQ3KKJ4_9LILI|nr:Pentatricopeptide repeat-containing protein [Canna indica]
MEVVLIDLRIGCPLVICSTICLREIMVSCARFVLRFRVSDAFSSRINSITSVRKHFGNALRTNRQVLELPKLESRTSVRLLKFAARLNDVLLGKQLHCLNVKYGFGSNAFLGSALVDMYSKFHFVEEARSAFDDITSKDLVVWNVMVSCYSLNGYGREGFSAFKSLRTEGFRGDGFTFSSLLNACSSLNCYGLGMQAHCMIVKLPLDFDVVVGSSLVDMYVKCGAIGDARQVFDLMAVRNVVTWNTIIVGYGKHGEGKEALKIFGNMLQGGLRPDELTIASILSSCANLAAANETMQVHGYVVKYGFQSFVSIGNALIMAYAKCGSVHDATRAFSLISTPDLVTLSSMIYSYAYHGLAAEAINIFDMMLHEGVNPDGITFLGLLSACSHAGLVDAGLCYFSSMIKDYQIKPSSEHYACLVDLLGRAGYLSEACRVLASMPFEPDANVLGSFIGACKIHRNARLAEWAADKLFNLEPNELVNYVLLSNIYVSEGYWEDVSSIRRRMKHTCGIKVPGCSWIEIGGMIHSFVSHDKSHLRSQEIVIKRESGVLPCSNINRVCSIIKERAIPCTKQCYFCAPGSEFITASVVSYVSYHRREFEMTDNDKGEEETISRGIDWEVVSLTASAYAAAPEVDKPIRTNENNENITDCESSAALFISGHFEFPPSEHENLPIEQDINEICSEAKGHNLSLSVADEVNVVNSSDEGKLQSECDDGLHTIEFFDKGSRNYSCDIGFDEGKGFQQPSVVGEGLGMFVNSETVSLYPNVHKRGNESEIEEPADTSMGSHRDHTKTNEDEVNGSDVPCQTYWKRHVASLYHHTKDSNKFWSIVVAAAVVGLVILGRRSKQDKWQLHQMKWSFSISDERMSRMLEPLGRFKDVLVGDHQPSLPMRTVGASGSI